MPLVAAMPPTPVWGVVALSLNALLWFLRASGLVGEPTEPAIGFAIVVLDLVWIILLLLHWAPARSLAAVGSLAASAAAILAFHEPLYSPRLLLFALQPLPSLVLFLGTPERGARRAAVIGSAALAFCALLAMALARSPKPVLEELVDNEAGYRLVLPEGYHRLRPEEALVGTGLPEDLLGPPAVTFGNRGERIYGLLTVRRAPEVPFIGGCLTMQRALGGASDARPVDQPASRALGQLGLFYEVHTPLGARGRLGCGRTTDGRFITLVVVTVDPVMEKAVTAFDRVGTSLALF
jgi:hypothetical protein